MASHLGSAHWAIASHWAQNPHCTAPGEAYATPNGALLLITPALLVAIALHVGPTPHHHFMPIK